MSLPSTITLNVGSPAADIVYGSMTQLDGQAVMYYAPSPQGDLAGRPTLRVSQETTQKGVQRTLVSFVTPIYDAASGTYKKFKKTDCVLNREVSDTVASTMVECEKMAKVLPLIDDIIAAGGT